MDCPLSDQLVREDGNPMNPIGLAMTVITQAMTKSPGFPYIIGELTDLSSGKNHENIFRPWSQC